jgi:hypothetical protein
LKNKEIANPFTARDVYHGKHWAGLSDPDEVEEVLKFLIEKHYLFERKVKTGGRSTIKYWVHPKIFEEKEGPKGS